MTPTIAERLAEMEEGIRKSIRSAEGDVRGTRHLAWELVSAAWADELAAIRAEVGVAAAELHEVGRGWRAQSQTSALAARLAPEHPDCDSCGGHGWFYEKDDEDVNCKTVCCKCNGGGKL